ncbi:hypothetical protein [Erwinia billingiae]|uniref:hypothetical protein n=1 Tax=Erwinia billingiae TaxID=182337 RepID=UPI0021570411|nr:hypothetical protein [Erwinia billingiae]
MKWLIILIFTLLTVSCSSFGAKKAENNLFNKVMMASQKEDIQSLSDVDYDQISHYISWGDARWVSLYPKLRRSPFLGITSLQEGLNISMAYALPENPSEVLKFVDELNIGAICGAPFIEPTQDEMDKYFSKTSAALKRLSSEEYWKKRCLLELNKSRRNNSSTVR